MRSGMIGFLGAQPPIAGDPYWENVVSLLRFDGAVGSSVFTDEKEVAWTSTGATIESAPDKPGETAGYFNGAADITSEALAALAMGTGDFTYELILRRAAGTAYQDVFDTRIGGTPGHGVYVTGANPSSSRPCVAHNTDVFLVGTMVVPALTWVHVAVIRVAGDVALFIDGAYAGAALDGRNLTGTRYRYGRSNILGQPFIGHIYQARITKGVARYTDSFTPPASFPVAA